MSRRRTDTELAADALDHLEMLHRRLARGGLDDQKVDSLSGGSDALRARIFGDEWHLAWATRNRIAHGDADVDLAVLTATVENDLPAIEAALRAEADDPD